METSNKNIYELYKKVFGNVYLKQIIFKFVITENDKQFKGYSYLDNVSRYKYDQIDLKYITKYNYYEFLKDKLKMGFEFKKFSFLKELLQGMLKIDDGYDNDDYEEYINNNDDNNNSNNNNNSSENNLNQIENQKLNNKEKKELLKSFYKIHKYKLVFCNNLDINDIEYLNLFECLISSKCMVILNEFINDYERDSNSFHINIKDEKKFWGLVFCSGDIKLIEFFHKQIKMDFTSDSICEYFNFNALKWSLSSNSPNCVNYLFDEMNYKIPDNKTFHAIIKPIFNKLFLIDFKLFIKIWNSIEPIYNKSTFIESFNINFSKRIYYFSEKSLNFKINKLLNFIQNIIYSQFKINKENKNHGKNSLLLKKIRKLIKFNVNKNDEKIIQSIKSIENLFKNEEQIKLNNIISILFKTNQQNNNNNNNFNNYNYLYKKYSKVKFEDFNLERELKRILIFDFLIPFKTNCTKLIDNILPSFIIEFASGFNEYQLILEYRSYLLGVYYFNNISKCNSIILDWCRIVSSRNADFKLVSFIFNELLNEINQSDDKFNNLLNQVSFGHHLNNPSYNGDQFDCRFFSIDHQISYLEILFKYNINYPITIQNVLKNIITNPFNIKLFTLKNYQDLGELIESYYSSIISLNYFKKFNSTILIGNNIAADYFYKFKNNLFHYWDGYFNNKTSNF
ncbi:hypothetical protein ACTFIW_003576 [Dictyostelium discoideum]